MFHYKICCPSCNSWQNTNTVTSVFCSYWPSVSLAGKWKYYTQHVDCDSDTPPLAKCLGMCAQDQVHESWTGLQVKEKPHTQKPFSCYTWEIILLSLHSCQYLFQVYKVWRARSFMFIWVSSLSLCCSTCCCWKRVTRVVNPCTRIYFMSHVGQSIPPACAWKEFSSHVSAHLSGDGPCVIIWPIIVLPAFKSGV